MKLPFLPIYIDTFYRGGDAGNAAVNTGSCAPIYFLSHAHTDHMAGLSAGWHNGILFCSAITRELLIQKLDCDTLDGGGVSGRCHRRVDPQLMSFADRCVALPMWERIALLRADTSESVGSEVLASGTQSARCSREPAEVCSGASGTHNQRLVAPSPTLPEVVYVTLISAFHIPGSVMLYFETPHGRLLYTGDFKFDAITAAPVLRRFFRDHSVDHVFIDDTWLHLGVAVPAAMPVVPHVPRDNRRSFHRYCKNGHQGGDRDDADGGEGEISGSAVASGTRILSKLLNATQLEEAIEALGRRLDAQRRRAEREISPSLDENASGYSPPPFMLRIYLHNQFGKEAVVQRIAQRLRTRAVLDDRRYSRVVTVAAALQGDNIDDDLEAATAWNGDGDRGHEVTRSCLNDSATGNDECEKSSSGQGASAVDTDDDIAAVFGGSGCGAPVLHSRTLAEKSSCTPPGWRERDVYPFDARFFASATEVRRLHAEIATALAEHVDDGDTIAARARHERLRRLCKAVPLIEVVGRRADVSPAALQAASVSAAAMHTQPFFSTAVARSTPIGEANTGVIHSGDSALQTPPCVPHYAVIMSGWAGQRPLEGEPTADVWHVPTTLHCTPQELVDFVALLRPLSVTPLHYRASRSPAAIMQRLGPFLRRPFVNQLFAWDTTALAVCGATMEDGCSSKNCRAAAIAAAAMGMCVDNRGSSPQPRRWRCVAAPPDVARALECVAVTARGLRREPCRQGYRIAAPAGGPDDCSSSSSSTSPDRHIECEDARSDKRPEYAVQRGSAVMANLSKIVQDRDRDVVVSFLSAGQLHNMCASYQDDLREGHDIVVPLATGRKRPRENALRPSGVSGGEARSLGQNREDAVSLASLAIFLA